MNSGQFALIKKDIRGITSNKQIFAVLLIVTLVLTIVLPSIFVLVLTQAPDAASDFQKLLDIFDQFVASFRIGCRLGSA